MAGPQVRPLSLALSLGREVALCRLAVWQSGPAPTELQLPVQLVVGSKSGLARGVVSPRSWLPVFWRGIVQHICPKSLSWHRAHDA